MSIPVIHTIGAEQVDVTALFGDAPLSSKIVIAIGLVVPLVSAYLTRRPNFITGMLTVLITVVAGIAAEAIPVLFAGERYDWGTALGSALPTLIVAWGAQSKLYKDTKLVKWLHRIGPVHGSDVDVTLLPPATPNWDQLEGSGSVPHNDPVEPPDVEPDDVPDEEYVAEHRLKDPAEQ